MKIFPDKFPHNIPYILSIFTGAIFIAFNLTGLVLEMKIGRPSSTSAIGFFFIPIYGVFFSGISFVFGLGLKFVIEKFFNEITIPQKVNNIIPILLLISVVISSLLGKNSYISYEETQRPHTNFSLMNIKKMSDSNFYNENDQVKAKWVFKRFDSVYDKDIKVEYIVWNDQVLSFESVENKNAIKVFGRDKNAEIILINLKGFDYIRNACAIPIALDDATGLAILVDLRSTSNRAMLLIYNSKAELIYQELLFRCGILDENSMKVVKDGSGKEYLRLYTGPEPFIYSIDKKINRKMPKLPTKH
jgi:hypothetical protein